jgi:hypothetical protein
MKSIISGGGPLVCVELELAGQWHGVDGSEFCAGSDSGSNDYERACGVADYAGRVSLGTGDALVLGDMPLETLIWKSVGGLPRVVRVYYGDPGVDVIQLLDAAGEPDFSDSIEMVAIEFKSSPIVVFDSAYPGNDVDVDRLFFDIPAGKYFVKTKRFELDERTSVLIHQFALHQ